MAVSFHRPYEARKHEEHLFPFDATYCLEKEYLQPIVRIHSMKLCQFLMKLNPTWQQLFHNDSTMIVFNERLHVSPEKKVQKNGK